MDTVFQSIRAIRKQKKISSQEMAQALNIDASNYTRMETGDRALTVDRLVQIAKIFGMEAGDILSYVAPKNVSIVPVQVRAGDLAEFFESAGETDSFSFPLMNEDDIKVITIEGDSMYPSFSHGDSVFIKRELNVQSIRWGEPYVIDCVDGRVLKRIYQNEVHNILTLVSDNTVYKPYDIALSEVISLWRVKGRFTKNLSPIRL